MFNKLFALVSLGFACTLATIAMDNKQVVKLTEDFWANVFGMLAEADQRKLAQTCTAFKKIYEDRACNYNESVGSFDKIFGCSNMVKNFFLPERRQSIDTQAALFYRKIAENRIGGTVKFSYHLPGQFNLFCESLENNSCITHLNLSKCRLDDTKVEQLATALTYRGVAQNLRILILSDNYLTYKDGIFILKRLPNLEKFDVSNNSLFCFNKKIDDSEITLNDFATNEQLKALNPVLSNLQVLVMNNSLFFIPERVDWLIAFLKTNTNMEKLYIAGNLETEESLQKIFRAADFAGNPLKLIDVAKCMNGKRQSLIRPLSIL